jgi:hypothetical protein
MLFVICKSELTSSQHQILPRFSIVSCTIFGAARLRYTEKNTKSARSDSVMASLALLDHGNFTTSTLQQGASSNLAHSSMKGSGTWLVRANGPRTCGRCSRNPMRKSSLGRVTPTRRSRSRNVSPLNAN